MNLYRNITRTAKLIGHTMQLSADSCALTECRWAMSESPTDENSSIKHENKILEMVEAQISEYLEGRRRIFTIPLRMSGTDFQIKVWNELRKISYGDTITYKELARRIGSPGAYRAVANACGANPFPIIIPCHRVVASGGKTGGYTGGIDIKLSLLKLEQTFYRRRDTDTIKQVKKVY